MDCPDPETLAAYREGGAPVPGLEAHFLECDSCREALILLGGEARKPSWVRWAAAAALLLVALPFVRPGKPKTPPSTPVQALDADLVLDAGARVLSEGPRRLRALGGRFWVEACGAPVELILPDVTLRLTTGSIAVDLPPSKAAWLLREAQAAQAGRVWVLEGSVQAGDVVVRAGQSMILEDGAAPRSADPMTLDALWKARALAAARLGGEPGPASLPRYRWVSVLRDRAASTELGLSFPVGDVWYQWVPGLASRPPEPPEVVEVLWDGSRLVGRVNGRTLLSARAGEVGSLLRESKETGWKVSGWGGSLSLESSRVSGP